MDIFWDLYQGGQIREAHHQALRGQRKAEELEDTIKTLEARVDRLVLLNTALWSLVKETSGLTDEVLAERVQEIDLQDGRLDGKVGPVLAACTQCGRTLSQKHRHCLYCGYESTETDAFRTVVR